MNEYCVFRIECNYYTFDFSVDDFIEYINSPTFSGTSTVIAFKEIIKWLNFNKMVYELKTKTRKNKRQYNKSQMLMVMLPKEKEALLFKLTWYNDLLKIRNFRYE